MMKSIRGQFMALNLSSILLCLLLIGGIGIWSVSAVQTVSTHEILSLTCLESAQDLNQVLDDIQSSVDLFCEMTDGLLSAPEDLHDPDYASAFFSDAERSMTQIAHVTRGVCAYYFRPAFELTEKQEGFFYSVKPGGKEFAKEQLTDLTLYDPADTEHVGWYYQPLAAGRAIWMEPYFNKNLGIYMVSYVVPLYRDRQFWGIAGMDVDFDVVIDQVRAIRPYRTGFASLIADNGYIYYHPELEIGSSVAEVCPDLRPLVYALSQPEPEDDIFSYKYRGVEKDLTFCRLRNGMVLLLSVERSEIHTPMISLLREVSLIAAALCVAVGLLIIPISNHITRPLEQLTIAAEEIALGNLDVRLPVPGANEVGRLTRSLEVTLRSLRQYVASMNDMAFSDPLTHVKNKTAYDRAALRLRRDMEAGRRDFGMVMLDLNDLKHVNDRYGHERGDEYLVNNCRFICSIFKHSPVYRIGGDEFLVLLTGTDLENLDTLLAEMDHRIEESRGTGQAWEQLSVAKGAAVCRDEDKTPEEVFIRADRTMYIDKRRMKVGR